MDFNTRLLCVGAFLLVEYFGFINGVTHQCVPGKYQNPIVWVKPQDPVVLKSPPNFKVLPSDALSCKWEVRPEWGTKLVMKVNEKNVDFNCKDNKLRVYSEKGTFDWKTECGNDTLPSLSSSTRDDGPIIVEFSSNSNENDAVRFSLSFESWYAPKEDNTWASQGDCSDGPCCQGPDCCVYNVVAPAAETQGFNGNIGIKPTNLSDNELWNGNYEAPGSEHNMDCTVKLKAAPGFQVSINFREMDMLEGTNGGCSGDFVHIYEDVETTTFGVFGKAGLYFCGQHLPNSPAPSVFVSTGNEIYIRYKTNEIEKTRGMGFKLQATAINPLVTMARFSHKYGDKTCWDKCSPTIPPKPITTTTPPPGPKICKKIFDKIFITNATTPHAYIPGAKINFDLKDKSQMEEEFSRNTDTNGLIKFSINDPLAYPKLKSGKTYSVRILSNGFVEKTVEIHLHCDNPVAPDICPSCYFSELVARTTPVPLSTLPQGKTTSAVSKGETPSGEGGEGTTPSGKGGEGTTPSGEGGESTTPSGEGTTPSGEGGEGTTPSGKITTPSGKGTTTNEEGTPPSPPNVPGRPPRPPGTPLVPVTSPPAVGTTSIFKKIKYPECGNKNFVSPTNQVICDCTITKCNEEVKRLTGICEPCIDIPLVEFIRTTPIPPPSTTPCVGDQCTPPPPPTSTTPCPLYMDEKVTVTVIDKATKKRIKDANITITHPTYGFLGQEFTDDLGKVTINVNTEGNHTVTLKKKDYEDSEQSVTLKCHVKDGCICSVEIETIMTRIERCKEGSSIVVKVLKHTGTPGYAGGTIKTPVVNFGNGSIDTKVTLNGANVKNVKGVFNDTIDALVFDVTGKVPDDFTIFVSNVGANEGKNYEAQSETIEFEMCKDNSPMTDDCCKKEHEIVVDFVKTTVPPITTTISTTPCTGPGCTTPKSTIPTTTLPCEHPTKDTLHVSICGDVSYSSYGKSFVTVETDKTLIMDTVELETISDGELTTEKCTGIYENKTLIKEFEPYLSGGRIIKENFMVSISGKNFEPTEGYALMDCTGLERCNNCTERLQVLIKPKVCDKEFYTIIVRDKSNNDEPLKGALVQANKDDGSFYKEKLTDKDGIVKIQFDRSIKQLQLTISKKGYTDGKSNVNSNCELKACGECSPGLETTIEPPTPPCKTPMAISVTVTDTDKNPVVNAAVILRKYGKEISNDDIRTNNNGKATITVSTNGTFQVVVESNSHYPQSKFVEVKDCKHTNETFEVKEHTTPAPHSTLEPCKYNEKVNINFKVLDITLDAIGRPVKDAEITVQYIEKDGQTETPIDIVVDMKTNANGELIVPANTNGNYSYSLSKYPYLDDPTTGNIKVNCDCDGSNCKPKVSIKVEKAKCDLIPYSENLCVNVTDSINHSPIPGAQVSVTLKKYDGEIITKEIGEETTPNEGVVCFLLPADGEYWLQVTQDNYVKYNEELPWKCNVEECQTCNTTVLVPLAHDGCPAELKVVIKNSTNNVPVIGAIVTAYRDGEDNGVQIHVAKLTTNETGIVVIPLDMNGKYTFTVEAEGFLKYTDTHVVDLKPDSQECDLYFPMKNVPMTSNDICKNGVRISLTWGFMSDPSDLDLYTFRVLYADSRDYCQTYYCDRKEQCGCTYFDTDNLYTGDRGAETITICCQDLYSYMLYVDDRSGNGKFLPGSEARLTLRSNIKEQKVNLEKPAISLTNKRYWIAGCLTTGNGNFKYIPVNQFTLTQPSSGEPLLCHNLVNTDREELKRASFPDNVRLSISALDFFTHEDVPGARLKLAAIGNDKIIQQELTTSDGSSRSTGDITFKVGENGKYILTGEKEGYTSSPVFFTLNCNKTVCDVPPLTTYFSKKLPAGDIRISLQYQMDTDFYLDLLQVNKLDSGETCAALLSYNYQTGKVQCPTIDLEWTSNPKFDIAEDGNGDSFVLKNASSNAKYTYLIYIKDITTPDDYTYLTLSDSKSDVAIKVTPPKQPLKNAIYIAGCLAIEGTSYNFVKKDQWTLKDPLADGRYMCHREFTKKDQPAKWKVRPAFCENALLNVTAQDTNGNVIDGIKTTTTLVDLDGTINHLQATELIGNGVYTTKVEADGYVTDIVERNVKCSVEECDTCNPNAKIILANKSEVESGEIVLTVTSQTNTALKFVVYEGQNVNMTKNQEENVLSIPAVEAKITLAVTFADLGETSKLNNTDAVFTLRYGDSLTKLKIPSDRYNGEKYWLIGSLQIYDDKTIELFSDNFYSNILEVFGSIERSIGLTLPAVIPASIDGGWSSYGECSTTCGNGTKTRTCTNPTPNFGGIECKGDASTYCNPGPCPIDGGWSGYGECTTTCGEGTKSRTCTNPTPSFEGNDCEGNATISCNPGPCVKDYSCESVADCYTSDFVCDQGFGCICKNNQCKLSSGCGRYDTDDSQNSCFDCDANGCDDEGICNYIEDPITGGECTGPNRDVYNDFKEAMGGDGGEWKSLG